jgi:cold shock CspA family protein
MREGRIKKIEINRGYGFVAQKIGRCDLFFYKTSLVGLEWSEQLIGRRVLFDLNEKSPKGPKAVNVRPAH